MFPPDLGFLFEKYTKSESEQMIFRRFLYFPAKFRGKAGGHGSIDSLLFA